jgi:beta-lactam-binding protein with PASTA domain
MAFAALVLLLVACRSAPASQGSSTIVSPSVTQVPSGTLTVPNLVGEHLPVALVQLKQLGLNGRVWSGAVLSEQGDHILAQRPATGTSVISGATIRLYIS